jgi:hypothetical protein
MDIDDFNARWLAAWTAKDDERLLVFYEVYVHQLP